jgi:hypothetical protein
MSTTKRSHSNNFNNFRFKIKQVLIQEQRLPDDPSRMLLYIEIPFSLGGIRIPSILIRLMTMMKFMIMKMTMTQQQSFLLVQEALKMQFKLRWMNILSFSIGAISKCRCFNLLTDMKSHILTVFVRIWNYCCLFRSSPIIITYMMIKDVYTTKSYQLEKLQRLQQTNQG